MLHYGLPGPSHLEDVTEMKLGWTVINELFSDLVEGLAKRCPNCRKLVIHGVISEIRSHKNTCWPTLHH